MKRHINPPREEWPVILARPSADLTRLAAQVKEVLDDVRKNGYGAIRHYTEKFDGVTIDDFRVSEREIADALRLVPSALRAAIEKAAYNITRFHATQTHNLPKVQTTLGVTCWQKAVPIDKVGLYIPGGSAPLFSTVLMLAIPAKIAGCGEIIMCTPPRKDGLVDPAILYAADLAGVHGIFKTGGIQAIGAMAYGAGDIPRMDKIFGPGNRYVMAAKQIVSMNDTAIDMPAGPSEVLVMADESANPRFVAADLLSQAEHGPDSQVILVTSSTALADDVEKEISAQLSILPKKAIAGQALDNSITVVLDNTVDMISMVNGYAPEHLIISMKDYDKIAEEITNAGSVFLGNYTPESAGDYASGTNHTLPTNGWARSHSGITLDSFMKRITFQEITREGLQDLGPTIQTMAGAEQLEAHSKAVEVRLKDINNMY